MRTITRRVMKVVADHGSAVGVILGVVVGALFGAAYEARVPTQTLRAREQDFYRDNRGD